MISDMDAEHKLFSQSNPSCVQKKKEGWNSKYFIISELGLSEEQK